MARLTELLARVGVNLGGVMGARIGSKTCLRFLAEGNVALKPELEREGFETKESQVLTLNLASSAEDLDRLTSALGEQGINILACYGHVVDDSAKFVLDVDRPEEAVPIVARACSSR